MIWDGWTTVAGPDSEWDTAVEPTDRAKRHGFVDVYLRHDAYESLPRYAVAVMNDGRVIVYDDDGEWWLPENQYGPFETVEQAQCAADMLRVSL